MTFGTLAWIHDSVASHPAKTMRNLAGALSGMPTITHANAVTPTTRGGSYGVVGGGDLLVTTTGTLGYSIAAGTALVTGTFATSQGVYGVYNDAAVTGSVGARNATNPRIDLICVRVRDTDTDATGSEDAGHVVVPGTAAASPVVPTLTSAQGSLLVLSEVLVPSAAAGTALTFTDRRMKATALGGIQRVTSATRPTTSALWEGQWIDESDTDRLYRYDGSAWQPMGNAGAWNTATISALAQGVGVSGGSLVAKYNQIGKQVAARVSFTVGSTGTNGSTITVTTTGLPTITAQSDCAGNYTYQDSGTGYYTGSVRMTTGGVLTFAVHGADRLGAAFACASPDTMEILLAYEAA